MLRLPSFLVLICLLLSAALPAPAQMFQSVAPDQATLVQEGPEGLFCPECGMNLVMFYKTSHAMDGHQYCSLHCLVDAHQELQGVRVVNVTSLDLIPAEKAFYVVGSDVKGTMSMNSKYAFADEDAAREFQTEHGGTIMDFAGAVTAAREDLARDKEMIEKKRSGAAEKGEQLFKAHCGGVDLPVFRSIAEAKTYLFANRPCGDLDEMQTQALAIYLASRVPDSITSAPLTAPEDAVCPVSGLYPAQHREWLAIVETIEGTRYYLAGPKNMFKFVQDPAGFDGNTGPEGTFTMMVTDYYSLNGENADECWYVVGSSVEGPSGRDYVPFRKLADAQRFSQEHDGQDIVKYSQIDKRMLLIKDK